VAKFAKCSTTSPSSSASVTSDDCSLLRPHSQRQDPESAAAMAVAEAAERFGSAERQAAPLPPVGEACDNVAKGVTERDKMAFASMAHLLASKHVRLMAGHR
jgi:hypothetical protein